ncbi:MAG: T9SS type A sorting domain-containing protein [Bacteroidota bacterium]
MGLLFLFAGDTHTLSGRIQWTDAKRQHPYKNTRLYIYADENHNQQLDPGESLIGETSTDAKGKFSLSIQHGKSAIFAGEFSQEGKSMTIGFPDASMPEQAEIHAVYLRTENKTDNPHQLLLSSENGAEIFWEMIPDNKGMTRTGNLIRLFSGQRLPRKMTLHTIDRIDELPIVKSAHLIVHYRVPGSGYLLSVQGNPAQYVSYQSHADIVVELPPPHSRAEPREVKWGHLKVENFDQERILEWMPTYNQSGDRFIIMRSADGMQYETVAVLPVNEQQKLYQYIDQDQITDSTLAYQIRQDHKKGRKSYSRVVTWQASPLASEMTFLASYRSENHQIQCRYKAPTPVEAHLRLVNHTGQELLQQRFRIKTSASQHDIEADSIPAGIYFLYLDWQGESLTQKIILP